MTTLSMNTLLRRAFVATALATIITTPATAQSSGPRWQAWLGCWTAAIPGQTIVDFKVAPVVCVTQTANADAVELATLSDTKVLARDTIDASGAEHVFNTKSCAGSQSARWSADERRIYLKSSSTCDGLKSTTSAILAMTEDGEWLDVRGLSAGGGNNVRVARYRAVQVPTSLLDSISGGSKLTPSAPARLAAGAPIGSAAVIEAVKNADAAVVESWILERQQKFSLDANTLVALADAGIPDRVTDAMVAVTHPNEFKFARAESGDDYDHGRRVYGGVMYPSSCDSYSRFYDPYDCRYNSYGYSRYGYNGYGYGYGYGYNGGYYYPTVIVVNGSTSATVRAQAVNGRGYSQGTTPSSGSAREKTGTTSTSTSSTSSSSGSTQSSSSGSSDKSSNSSSGSSRTAHGRP